MVFSYSVATNSKEILHLSKLALKYKLYHSPTWMLKHYLQDEMAKQIVVAFSGRIIRKPVGVAIMTLHGILMVYVNPNYRLKGIGTDMILKLKLPKHLITLDGIMGSRIFYQKLKKKIKDER